MNIIFITKRQYMQKDVIDDRYARLYEIPNEIAIHGHQVLGICLSYRKRKEGVFEHLRNKGLLVWYSNNIGLFIIPGLIRFIYKSLSLIKSFKADVIIGSSDCPMVFFTALLARLTKKPYFLDLYDNYESFGLASIPAVLPLYRWAIKSANGIYCVSEPLSDYIRQFYKHTNVITLESTIKGGDFYPKEKKSSREGLSLPILGTLIGVAGSLNKERGIGLLYDSFLQLADSYPDLHLVLAGTPDKALPIPEHPRIHYLGLLPHQAIVNFYSALDLAVVCMRDTEFGRYAFPQKTYEILACRTPVVTAKLGALKQTFKLYPQCLYEPDNQADLKKKIENLINNPEIIEQPIPTWREQAFKLIEWIQAGIDHSTVR